VTPRDVSAPAAQRNGGSKKEKPRRLWHDAEHVDFAHDGTHHGFGIQPIERINKKRAAWISDLVEIELHAVNLPAAYAILRLVDS